MVVVPLVVPARTVVSSEAEPHVQGQSAATAGLPQSTKGHQNGSQDEVVVRVVVAQLHLHVTAMGAPSRSAAQSAVKAHHDGSQLVEVCVVPAVVGREPWSSSAVVEATVPHVQGHSAWTVTSEQS